MMMRRMMMMMVVMIGGSKVVVVDEQTTIKLVATTRLSPRQLQQPHYRHTVLRVLLHAGRESGGGEAGLWLVTGGDFHSVSPVLCAVSSDFNRCNGVCLPRRACTAEVLGQPSQWPPPHCCRTYWSALATALGAQTGVR